MGVVDFIKHRMGVQERGTPTPISLAQYAQMIENAFTYQGLQYTYPNAQQEDFGRNFAQMSQGAYKGSGVVFACILSRMQLFSEMRFMYRRLRQSRPTDLFGDRELRILERPWENGTTGDLLAKILLYSDLAGNAYVVRRGGRLTPLRPDWMTIVGGVPGDGEATVWHPDARILGYLYQEGGPALDRDPIVLLPEEVAHFAPNPDPEARFAGMSWITPVVREVMADKAATEHKLTFFENGATVNLAVKMPTTDIEKMRSWIELFEREHYGAANAYRTLFLVEGADAVPVGSDLKQLDFKVTQGAGETRIAAAAGVPPVIVGLSEGLQAATYSNYAQARRRFADNTIRPLWRNVCGSLSTIVDVPSDAELWYDDRDIAALQEDAKDAAEIAQVNAQTLRTYIEAGFEPDSAVKALDAQDVTLLKHTGLTSVQLQEPGAQEPVPELPVPVNGNGRASEFEKELYRHLALEAARKDPQETHVHLAPTVVNVPEREVNIETPVYVPAQEPPVVNLPELRAPDIKVNVPTPAVNVAAPNVTVESPSVTVEAPNVTVEPPEVRVEPTQVKVDVEAPEVNVELRPEISLKSLRRQKKVKFQDGREASVDGNDVTFSDGTKAVIED